MEASTNLIGGQPFSMSNLMDVRRIADKYNLMLVLDASLLGENAYLIQQREEHWKENSMADIIKAMTGLADLVYFSARKLTLLARRRHLHQPQELYNKMEAMIPLFEGFLTYGGISVREIEAMAVGLYETQDETVICQSIDTIRYLVNTLDPKGIPVVTPAGVLGGHLDAMKFCEHIPQEEYPAGALAAALPLLGRTRVWSAVRYRASATRTAKRSWPTSSWYASPARAAYSRFPRSNTSSTVWSGSTRTVT